MSADLSIAVDYSAEQFAATDVSAAEKDFMAGLIDRVAQQQNRSAYIRIYKYFAPRVKSFLLGKGLNSATADEVLQEVMLAVWQKAHLYNPKKAAASTWIFTISRNKYVDMLRRDRRGQCGSDESDLDLADMTGSTDSTDSTDEIFDHEKKHAVHEALNDLCPEQREVIVLSFIKGLAHSEISSYLDLPLGTVKSRIRLAFKNLRESLGEFQRMDGLSGFEPKVL